MSDYPLPKKDQDKAAALAKKMLAVAKGHSPAVGAERRLPMTFLELRRSLVDCINQAKNLSPEEIYGVVASVETEVRYILITTIPRPEIK